ncbi:MAG: hypothetical protein O2809_03595 [Proteobacteria bacterium]|nr:hypothetical protein [Pseudomonadota bacterium]
MPEKKDEFNMYESITINLQVLCQIVDMAVRRSLKTYSNLNTENIHEETQNITSGAIRYCFENNKAILNKIIANCDKPSTSSLH